MVIKRLVNDSDLVSEIQMPNHLKSGSNGRHFVKKHLKFGQKRPDFEWLGFQMVGTIAIATAIAINKTI